MYRLKSILLYVIIAIIQQPSFSTVGLYFFVSFRRTRVHCNIVSNGFLRRRRRRRCCACRRTMTLCVALLIAFETAHSDKHNINFVIRMFRYLIIYIPIGTLCYVMLLQLRERRRNIIIIIMYTYML